MDLRDNIKVISFAHILFATGVSGKPRAVRGELHYSAASVMRKRLFAVQKEDRNLSARIEMLKKRLKKRMEQSQG